jgi:hypothetical protein
MPGVSAGRVAVVALQAGVKSACALLQSLSLRPLTLGLGQPLLRLAFVVGGPQFGLGAFAPGPGGLLLGRGLRRLSPG